MEWAEEGSYMHKDVKWFKQTNIPRLPRAKFHPTHTSVTHRQALTHLDVHAHAYV